MMNSGISNQLTLGVGLKDEATFQNYVMGKNAQLVQALRASVQGEGERVFYFYGSSGLGRTHLLQACCREAHQWMRAAVYIPVAELIDLPPDMLEGLETIPLVCIDDVHLLEKNPRWEEAFFHLYNRIYDAGGHLIVSANVAPLSLNLKLPDVKSRLSWGITFQLQHLTDAEKVEALIIRAEQRGMTLPEEVAKFILTHCPRNMATLFAALEVLDKMSLAAQRKLTVPFVKKVLEI